MAARLTPGHIIGRAAVALTVIALMAAGTWLYARSWAPSRKDYPVQGVSVSSADGAVEWGTVAAQGADFAYIRAASAAGRDPAYAANRAAARAAGMRFGPVLDYSACRSIANLATLFVTTVSRDNAALPPVIRLDFAPGCAIRPERDKLLADLNTLINLVEGHAGKPVLLHVTEAFDRQYDIGGGINRTLWLDGNFFPPDYASRPWVMWTASDMRHIDGVDGPVHWNVVAP